MQGILSLQQFIMSKGKARAKSAEKAEPIIAEISEVLRQIECVKSRFEYTTDYDIIEACIYEEKSLLSRYSHLLTLAKDKGIYCTPIENILVSKKGA